MKNSYNTSPGNNTLEEQKGLYRKLFWIAVAGSVLIYFWGIWQVPVLTHNEARRMIVVQEMLSNHNYLIPTINNEIYIEKPPLVYWLALPFAMLFKSTNEWVLRLPIALCAFGFTWLLFQRVNKHFGRWPGLFSALILITCMHFSNFSRLTEIPTLMTVCCASAVLFYFDYLQEPGKKGFLFLAYACLGLGFLTKGPVALIFFISPILVFGFVYKERNALKGLIFIRGWLIFALLAFPWYLYVLSALDKGQLGGVIQKDIVHKVGGSADSGPFYLYVLVLLGSFAPWSLVLAYKTKANIKTAFATPNYAYFGYAFIVPVVIMSFFSAREANYIVPILPHAAIFLGIWVTAFFEGLYRSWKDRLDLRLSLAIAALVMVHVLYYSVIMPRIFRYKFEAFDPVISMIRKQPEDIAVYGYKNLFYQLVYYHGKPIPRIGDKEVEEMVMKKKAFILIAENKHWDHLKALDSSILLEYKPFINKKRAVRVYCIPNKSNLTDNISESRPEAENFK
ncbi:putative Glycosyltransferase [uncultured Desulfobacterium sp.]|uniref:Putative Glycosyltransferase n=1 Tax=uncultured Desulfobacterium sp. TaxID=201089 RepID=A0A445MS22_9BACT|nr:putative Glycosyltransferase [uncultured Desulfobacterium sp.]